MGGISIEKESKNRDKKQIFTNLHICNQFTRKKNNNPDLVAVPGNPYIGGELFREKADGHLFDCLLFCCHKIKCSVYV